jgi:hypothetical protein
MGRKPKQRVSFYDDAQHLLRMGKAVLDDSRLPMEWRGRIEAKARDLASELLSAPLVPEAE